MGHSNEDIAVVQFTVVVTICAGKVRSCRTTTHLSGSKPSSRIQLSRSSGRIPPIQATMAPQIIHNLNDLVLALTMLSANDTKLIKKSEKMLKTFLKTPANASYLVLILRNHTSEVAVRHHAALLLKKKIGKFYAKYPPQQQAELKTELLSLLVNEPEAVIATGERLCMLPCALSA